MNNTTINDILNKIYSINKSLITLQNTIKNNCTIDDLKNDYFENIARLLCNNFITSNKIKTFFLSFIDLRIQLRDCEASTTFDDIENDLLTFKVFLNDTINDLKNNN